MKILIPTCKPIGELKIVDELHDIDHDATIILQTSVGSAAYNRNRALEQVELGEIVIMMDDDMTGFFTDWATLLVEPFKLIPDTVMVSARLMRKDGRYGVMVGENYDLQKDFVIVDKRRLPTACIAFRHDGTMFDENFLGSGFEDDDFCKMKANKYPDGVFVINNLVKLIHLNEMKNQKGEYWKHNKNYYLQKHLDEVNRWE